jgi:hypothetical protein
MLRLDGRLDQYMVGQSDGSGGLRIGCAPDGHAPAR